MAKKSKNKQQSNTRETVRPSRTLSINIEYGADGLDLVTVVADGDTWKHPTLRDPLNKLAATLVALLSDAGDPGTLSELLKAEFELPKMPKLEAKVLVRGFLSQVDVGDPEPYSEFPEPDPELLPNSETTPES